MTQKAIKGQGIADKLSEAPSGGFEPLKTYFIDDNMMIQRTKREDTCQFWKLYFDGATNAEGTGAVLISIIGGTKPRGTKTTVQ